MEDVNLKTHSPIDLQKKGFKTRLVTSLDNFLRRTLDICASLAGLIFLSPIFLLIAVLIKRDSPGPVFFRGLRAGKEDRDFYILWIVKEVNCDYRGNSGQKRKERFQNKYIG